MTLLEAREAFTDGLSGLLSYGHFLCESYSDRDGCKYTLILDETKRSKQAARWNAEHCRVTEDGHRCERTRNEHAPDLIEHDFKPIGIADSTHTAGLAGDILILRDGEVVNDGAIYRDLGQWWKRQNPEFRWGGDFAGFLDLGHFSHEWNGRK